MVVPSLSLRGKILFGSLLLIVPLFLALGFVYQFGSDRLRVAEREKQGLSATGPLWKAVFGWQRQDEGAVETGLRDFGAVLGEISDDLIPGSDGTTGATWVSNEALQAAVPQAAAGDDLGTLHKALITNILVLADTSGLVLDPELATYYLVLATYQSVPNLVEKLTDLHPLTLKESAELSASERLLLYSRSRELKIQAEYLHDQVTRAIRAIPATGPFAEAVKALEAQVAFLVDTTAEFEARAAGPALGEPFNAEAFRSLREGLIPGLEAFHSQGIALLTALLDRRIAGITADLAVAFSAAGIGLALGLGLLLVVIAGIRRRAFGLVASLGALTQNDLTRSVPESLVRSGDELGRLARSVATLQKDLKQQVTGIEAVLGDLSQIASNLSSTVEQSSASIEQMSAITAAVARASEAQSGHTDRSRSLVTQMVDRVHRSNDLTQSMAAQFFLFSQSMEANRNRIRETAAEAQATGVRAEGLGTTGAQGKQSLEDLRRSIGGVVQRTGEIQEVVRFILDIADRTSLLSMNAAIEAARAGSAGRGFKVVADEIRKLAESSSHQAQTIRDLLTGISDAVDETLVGSEATAGSFAILERDIAEVKNSSQDIARKMAAQEAEDENLSAGLHQFAQFYAQLSEILDLQAEESTEVLADLEKLSDSGRQISHSMAEQKIGMEQSTAASVQARDATITLGQVTQVLELQVGRFKT